MKEEIKINPIVNFLSGYVAKDFLLKEPPRLLVKTTLKHIYKHLVYISSN